MVAFKDGMARLSVPLCLFFLCHLNGMKINTPHDNDEDIKRDGRKKNKVCGYHVINPQTKRESKCQARKRLDPDTKRDAAIWKWGQKRRAGMRYPQKLFFFTFLFLTNQVRAGLTYSTRVDIHTHIEQKRKKLGLLTLEATSSSLSLSHCNKRREQSC